MNTLNNMIADIMPKDLVLLDIIQDESKIKVIVDGAKSIDLDTTAYIAKKIRKSISLKLYLIFSPFLFIPTIPSFVT